MSLFVHLMPIDSPLFHRVLIKIIHDNMDASEHLFVLKAKEGFEDMRNRGYTNIVFAPDMNLDTIHKYEKEATALILHSLFLSSLDICRMKSKSLKKIVWCVWGHDLYKTESKGMKSIKSIIKSMSSWVAQRKIAKFRAIAAGFKYDERMIRQLYGDRVPVFNAVYSSGYYRQDVDAAIKAYKREDARINIMIGHSAFDFLKHSEYLQKLIVYKDEPIRLTLVLSYGSREYADHVIQEAIDLFGSEKVHVITSFLSSDDYVKLLCDVDIAIFDYEHQAALGNLILLSYMGKKLYLSPSGLIASSFKSEKVETYDCREIGKIPFAQLKERRVSITPPSTSEEPYGRGCLSDLLDKDKISQGWKKLFNVLR